MRRFAAIGVTLALWPGVAAAGWHGAEWGMTPEQVFAALGEQARRSKGASGDRLGGKTIENVGTYALGNVKLKTIFYYDDRGLESVALQPASPKVCAALGQSVIDAQGKPVRVSDQAILRLVIWHDIPAANRIRLLLMGGGGGCTLYYERLSDYEAVDKRQR